MRWTRNHGLNSFSVSDLGVDSRGVIWVSTNEGIYRHHGNVFENLNKIIENSPLDNPTDIYDLYIDKKDRMWIGSVENGLMMYDIRKNIFTHYEALIGGHERLSNLRVYGIHTLNDSILRFTSHTHGLIDYNLWKNEFTLIKVFTDSIELEALDGFQKMIRPVETSRNGMVANWYSSLTGMIEYNVQLDSFIYYDDGEHIRIRKAIMDEDSLVWCVTYGQGLYSFDINTKLFTNYRCHQGKDWSHPCLTGGTIETYNDSTLILDSEDGLYYFNKINHSFTRFYDILPHSQWSGTTNEMEWINDELWQASLSSTLYRHFKDDHGVKSVSIGTDIDEVYYDNTRKAYITTSKPNLITIHRTNDYTEIHVPATLLKEGFLEGVTSDQNGNLWIATNNQILRYNEVTNTYRLPFKELLDSIPGELTFRKIGTHPNGSIWLASHDGTIFTFDPSTLAYKFYGGTFKESIQIEYNYRALLEDFTSDGYTWFSSQEGFFGLSPDDQNHKFCKNIRDRKTNQPITLLSPSIGIGNDGKICFGTKTNEIYLVDKDSLNGGFADILDLKNVIPNLSINDIEIDENNIIWISTKMGLIKINRAKEHVELYGDTHRLEDLGELEIQGGTFIIGISSNRFNIINPDKLTPFYGKPNIQLLIAEIDSKPIKHSDGTIYTTGQKIELGPKDNFLRIKFNDFNYVSQQPKTYAIKIEGLHEDWIDLKERNEFGFSGLPGGYSNVWVKSKLQFAKEYSEPVNLLTVHVIPPFTRRKSFWALCSGLFLLLFYLGYRYRLSQLKEKQNLMIAFNKQLAETEMKALRAQMNPHFLFNVLNAIKLNVQKNEQDNAIDIITDFSKLIRSVLQNSGKKRITLAEELQTLELYIKIEQKRFSTSFEYSFTIDQSINTEEITIPPMLLQPYVENAIWHGILHKTEGKGQIKIKTYRLQNSIVIEIMDNGIGRKKANSLKLKTAQKNKSMGMQITRDRMAISNKISNDHIEVNIEDLYDASGQSTGTKVMIVID
jgi:streptogramin lyase